MIRELHLNNFKKHGHRSFYFTEGLNGIFGANYTGKSTILYGILYALGGASQVPGTNLQKMGTNSGMSVTMWLDIGSVRYSIDRKKTGAYLYRYQLTPKGEPCQQEMIASGTSNVNEKISELIGMPMKRFRHLKYAEQKKAHALLTLGAGELHKIIEELTGIDQINSALLKLKDIISESKGAVDALEFHDPEKLYSEEEELAILSTEMKGELEEVVATCTRINERWEKLNTKYSVMTSRREAVQQEKEAVAELSSKLEIRVMDAAREEKDQPSAESLLNTRDREEEVAARIGILEFSRGQASAAKSVLNSDLERQAECVRYIKDTSALMESDQKEVDSISANIETLAMEAGDKWGELKDRHRDLSRELKDKSDMFKNSFCPTCNREFDDACHGITEEDLHNLSDQVQDLAVELNQAKEQKDLRLSEKIARQDAIRNLDRNREALKKETATLESIEEKIAETRRDMADYDLEAIESEIKELKKEQKSLQKILNESQERTIRIDDLNSEIKLLEQSLADRPSLPPFDQEEYDDLKEKIDAAAVKNLKWKDHSIELNTKLSGVTEKLSSVRKDIEIVESRNKQYNEAKAKHGTAVTLRKFLTDNRDRYTGEVWRVFMGSASNFISSCTSGNISEIERTESGKFKFIENDVQMDIRDASGAQEAIMGLAVQLALAESAQCPLDILLVDEPTADMDADHSMAVAGVLSTKGSQIIAISHREMDASLCQNVINM